MIPKERPRTRSQFPAAAEVDPALPTAATPTAPEASRGTAVVLASGLLVLFPVTLEATESACFGASITAANAVKNCEDVSAHDVFHEYARCVRAYVPWLGSGALRGYGPLRARYGSELAVAMTPSLDAHATATTTAVASSAQSSTAVALTRPARRLALRSLRNVLGHDAATKARIRKALKDGSARGRIDALDRLRAEVHVARASIPARVLEDAGLTPAVLDALTATSQRASDARASARDHRQQAQVLRADLAEPGGRLLHELRLLLASARDSRAFDKTIPTTTSWLVTRGAPRMVAKLDAAPVTPKPA